MTFEEHEVSIKLNGRAVKLLLNLLIDAHKNWPGGNPQEQEDLYTLKNGFYRAYMDCIFTMESDKPR